MTLETALPAATPVAEASVDQAQADPLATQTEASTEAEGEQAAKPEKTPEQREIERLRRGIDRKTRQLAEERARRPAEVPVQPKPAGGTNPASQVEDEPLTLSRAELDKLVKQRAAELAPTIQQQSAEMEHRRGVVGKLAKEWGQEKFDAMASDLDDALGGLQDDKGRPKPITDAIFESDTPQALIEYLADPDNADEADRLARMSAVQAGREIAKLEAKLSAAKGKPKPSGAPAPLESLKGAAKSTGMPDPANTKAYIKWANEQERRH